MFAPLRRHPERWLFTGLVALVLAPVCAQGLDRPLAALFAGQPGGAPITGAALFVAVAVWLVGAARAPGRSAIPWILAALVAAASGLAVGAGPSSLVALAAVAAVSLGLAAGIPGRLPPALDGLARRHRVLTAAYTLAAVLSVVLVARVSVFMADPTRTDAQLVPGVKFIETHSCLTAYVRADELAHDRVENLYLAERWPSTVDAEVRPETAFSPFDVDAYFYPPSFLLLAEVLTPLRGDFLAQRALWFGLNGVLVAVAFGIAAWGFGGPRWHRPLLLAPLFFGSVPTLLLLQIGNAQALVVVVAILAMFAFEVGRPALGGLGLALATASKISPGIFGVVLLVQRRWRAALWTAALGAALVLVTLIAYGVDPIASWIGYALPRLGSGEAFSPMLHHPESIAMNAAPSGLPFKLELLGIDVGDPWPLARRINQLFTIVVVALAVILGRRAPASPEARTRAALAWMALLYLGALRSPFAPGYVAFGFVWALTFLSVEVESRRGGVALLLLILSASLLPPMPVDALTVYLLVPQAASMGVAAWLILRRPPARA